MKNKLPLLFTLVVLFQLSFAQTLLKEPFSYGTTDNILFVGPGGATTNWTVDHMLPSDTMCAVKYRTSNLFYPGYSDPLDSTNGGLFQSHTVSACNYTSPNTWPLYMRSFSPVTSNSIYVSFLFRHSISGAQTPGGGDVFFLKDSLGNNAMKVKLFWTGGDAIINSGLAMWFVRGNKYSMDNYIASQLYTRLIVLRYTFYPGPKNDSVYAWIFNGPAPLTEPTPLARLCDTSANDVTHIKSFCMNDFNVQSYDNLDFKIDDLRIGTSWANTLQMYPLPVIWNGFSVESLKEKGVKINWSTASEINNDYFVIEQSSDYINWTTLGTVRGKGNSNVLSNYEFQDVINHTESVLYYRIKQVDFDGKYSYSKVASINNVQVFDKDMTVYPNPFDDKIFLKFNQPTGERVAIRVFSCEGRLVYENEITNMTSYIEPSIVKGGMYMMEVKTNQTVKQYKLIKQ